ncbi:hypothetical protein T265_09415 [Opisthorchis viverrini]|uniref:Ig-like domain-containing protein n=1 Tax=Opisthorchis viverrini TaxID=6198 RepID=A0A074ZAA5_OPIVI|nr:hypothetical protein T265_09415 [Opisthorchis viverrini]KER22522.1 hypothetical protein T265_09415 [Opisthorchis viverrini]
MAHLQSMNHITVNKIQCALVLEYRLFYNFTQRKILATSMERSATGNAQRSWSDFSREADFQGVCIQQWLTTLKIVQLYLVLDKAWTAYPYPACILLFMLPPSEPKNEAFFIVYIRSSKTTQLIYSRIFRLVYFYSDHHPSVLFLRKCNNLHPTHNQGFQRTFSCHHRTRSTLSSCTRSSKSPRSPKFSCNTNFRRSLGQIFLVIFLMFTYLPTRSLSSFTLQNSAFIDSRQESTNPTSYPIDDQDYHPGVQYLPDITMFEPSIPHLPCRYRFRNDVEASALLADNVIVGLPLETYRRRYGPMYNISVYVTQVLKETPASLFPIREQYLIRVGQFSVYPDLGRCQIDAQLNTPYIFFIRRPNWAGFCQVSQLPVRYSKQAVKRIQRILRLGPYPLQMRPLHHADQLEADENNDVLLTCRVRGRPTPLISWYHNDTEIKVPWKPGSRYGIIQQSQNLSKLQLAKLQLTDAGNYTCLAENLNGHIRKSVQLVVRATSTTSTPTTTTTSPSPTKSVLPVIVEPDAIYLFLPSSEPKETMGEVTKTNCTVVRQSLSTISENPLYDARSCFGTIKLIANQHIPSRSSLSHRWLADPSTQLTTTHSPNKQTIDLDFDQEPPIFNEGNESKHRIRTFSAPASINSISRDEKYTVVGNKQTKHCTSQSMSSLCRGEDLPSVTPNYRSICPPYGQIENNSTSCIHQMQEFLQLRPTHWCSSTTFAIADDDWKPQALPSHLLEPDSRLVHHINYEPAGTCSTLAYQNPCFGRDRSYLFFDPTSMDQNNMLYFLNNSTSVTNNCTTFQRSTIAEPHDQDPEGHLRHMTHSRSTKYSPRIVL